MPTVSGFTGYGSSERARVVGRVLMEDPATEEPSSTLQRGYRQFLTTPVPGIPVAVTLGATTVTTRANDEGYIEVLIEGHELEPGWHDARISVALGDGTSDAPVQIISDAVTHGVIADIDDTIMITQLPRTVMAVWNSWVIRSVNRRPVAGMARFLTSIRTPEEPVFYLSTGAWNTYDMLRDFMRRHGFPAGAMLLTDWGPTPTAIFRSGPEHKRVQLRNLLIDFPNITWTLVGDNGQHDPMIYSDVVFEHPNRVKLVAIRELTPSEHILAHGTTRTIEQPGDYWEIPAIFGADGDELMAEFKGL